MPALERSNTSRQLRLLSATSRAGAMAFVRQIIQRNCWWQLPNIQILIRLDVRELICANQRRADGAACGLKVRDCPRVVRKGTRRGAAYCLVVRTDHFAALDF